jgi:hypothetical protein
MDIKPRISFRPSRKIEHVVYSNAFRAAGGSSIADADSFCGSWKQIDRRKDLNEPREIYRGS